MAFPRARQFERVFTESVGSDIVMYVESGVTMEYHTLANGAYAIWRAADGHRDETAIAEMVFGDRSELSITRVEVGLTALLDAGLLESDENMMMNRRLVTKLAAAALLGGIGLPMVTSITAPASADGLSPLPVPTKSAGSQCTAYSDICEFGSCCCHNPEVGLDKGWCRIKNECVGYPCV